MDATTNLNETPRKKAICDWDVNDRPREKFMAEGGQKLKAAELLAILVGSGNAEEDAVTLMQRILDDHKGSLKRVGQLPISELCRYKGIGPAKAVTILAACEFGVRRALEGVDIAKLDSSEKIYHYFYPKLRHLEVEEAHILLLTQRLGVIKSVMIGRGGLDRTMVDIRVALREAIVGKAPHIVLCHNHPSGDCTPSAADNKLTSDLKRACDIVGIRLIDHIVFTDGNYYSYCDEGKI